MTSKEKAVQLFNKYYVSILEVNNDLSEEIIISILAKKQALIAVDEIMNICPFIKIEFATSEGGKETDAKEYWMQVKKELSIL